MEHAPGARNLSVRLFGFIDRGLEPLGYKEYASYPLWRIGVSRKRGNVLASKTGHRLWGMTELKPVPQRPTPNCLDVVFQMSRTRLDSSENICLGVGFSWNLIMTAMF